MCAISYRYYIWMRIRLCVQIWVYSCVLCGQWVPHAHGKEIISKRRGPKWRWPLFPFCTRFESLRVNAENFPFAVGRTTRCTVHILPYIHINVHEVIWREFYELLLDKGSSSKRVQYGIKLFPSRHELEDEHSLFFSLLYLLLML